MPSVDECTDRHRFDLGSRTQPGPNALAMSIGRRPAAPRCNETFYATPKRKTIGLNGLKEKGIPELLRLNLGKTGTKLKRNVETELLKLTNSEFLSETATAVPRHKTAHTPKLTGARRFSRVRSNAGSGGWVPQQ